MSLVMHSRRLQEGGRGLAQAGVLQAEVPHGGVRRVLRLWTGSEKVKKKKKMKQIGLKKKNKQ